MFKRPYTCVMIRNGATEVVDVDAPDGYSNALCTVKGVYPDSDVLALIPGQFSSNAYAYTKAAAKPASGNRIDPFELPHEPADRREE